MLQNLSNPLKYALETAIEDVKGITSQKEDMRNSILSLVDAAYVTL